MSWHFGQVVLQEVALWSCLTLHIRDGRLASNIKYAGIRVRMPFSDGKGAGFDGYRSPLDSWAFA